jgi:hypothetical protein
LKKTVRNTALIVTFKNGTRMTRIVRIGADSALIQRDPRKSAQFALSAFYSFCVESKFDKVRIGE